MWLFKRHLCALLSDPHSPSSRKVLREHFPNCALWQGLRNSRFLQGPSISSSWKPPSQVARFAGRFSPRLSVLLEPHQHQPSACSLILGLDHLLTQKLGISKCVFSHTAVASSWNPLHAKSSGLRVRQSWNHIPPLPCIW